jgi:hypothetical protein
VLWIGTAERVSALDQITPYAHIKRWHHAAGNLCLVGGMHTFSSEAGS